MDKDRPGVAGNQLSGKLAAMGPITGFGGYSKQKCPPGSWPRWGIKRDSKRAKGGRTESVQCRLFWLLSGMIARSGGESRTVAKCSGYS